MVVSIAAVDLAIKNTFLTSKSPTNAKGRPGSCTGNREKPLVNLFKVQPLYLEATGSGEQIVQFLVVKNIVGTDSNDILTREPNQRRGTENGPSIHNLPSSVS